MTPLVLHAISILHCSWYLKTFVPVPSCANEIITFLLYPQQAENTGCFFQDRAGQGRMQSSLGTTDSCACAPLNQAISTSGKAKLPKLLKSYTVVFRNLAVFWSNSSHCASSLKYNSQNSTPQSRSPQAQAQQTFQAKCGVICSALEMTFSNRLVTDAQLVIHSNFSHVIQTCMPQN